LKDAVETSRGPVVTALHTSTSSLREAQLLMSLVIICRYTVLVCNKAPRPTQPPTLSGIGNEYRHYRPVCSGSALRPGRWLYI